ncbi:hypothetical protein NOVO_00215 [Rickettsiales bacterium Ac37b]|nr:hypothetical protein NOVO_00215 [Rickettsiales bacterium Ac37b]
MEVTIDNNINKLHQIVTKIIDQINEEHNNSKPVQIDKSFIISIEKLSSVAIKLSAIQKRDSENIMPLDESSLKEEDLLIMQNYINRQLKQDKM